MTFDELRTAKPRLGFAVYAYKPGAPVTLEVHTEDGQVFDFTAATEEAAIERAFPAPVSGVPLAAECKTPMDAARPSPALSASGTPETSVFD